MKRFILIMAMLALIVTTASAQRFRGGGFRGGGFRGSFGYHGGGYYRGGYGYGGYRSYGGLYFGLGLGLGLGYYNPFYYGYPYYGYPAYPYYSYPPDYEQVPQQQQNAPPDSYRDNGGGYYNNDTIYSQKPSTPGPGPTEGGNNPSSRKWVPAHWKHTDEGWIWIDGYWKNQQ